MQPVEQGYLCCWDKLLHSLQTALDYTSDGLAAAMMSQEAGGAVQCLLTQRDSPALIDSKTYGHLCLALINEVINHF